mmetsp:Transcript_1518/g.4588  ORF Transcript_1518/g.4588 Transcript_1518/m.4588 type:complete len:100 (-) Transcript_1518:127-426(-)
MRRKRWQGGGEINTQYAGQQARAPGYALRAYPSLARQALGLLGASHAELMLHHHVRSAPLCEALWRAERAASGRMGELHSPASGSGRERRWSSESTPVR